MVGYLGRVFTAGVIGANIGAGIGIIHGLPFALLLLAWAANQSFTHRPPTTARACCRALGVAIARRIRSDADLACPSGQDHAEAYWTRLRPVQIFRDSCGLAPLLSENSVSR